MKQYKFLICLFFSYAFLAASCKKFLDTELDKAKVLTEEVFNSDATAQSAVAGLYRTLRESFMIGGANGSSLIFGLSSDEIFCNIQQTTHFEFEQNDLIATNGQVSQMWRSMYAVIYQANMILERLELSKNITPSVKQQLTGEAKFIRAICNFYLLNIFGDVPLITSTDYRQNALVSRTPSVNVYDHIVSDLNDAQSLLDATYLTGERTRVNKYSATAFLARVYLYRNNWSKAEEQATNVINQTSLYSIVPQLNNVFLKGSKEAIFQLGQAIVIAPTADGAVFNPNTGSAKYGLTSHLLNSFESGDNRRSQWIGTHTVPAGTLYFANKYKQYLNVTAPSTASEYFILLRFSEQYLIRAEARAKLGNIPGAQADLNIVRNRAGLGNTPASDETALLTAIEKERRIEYFAETGHRWFDLKRWNRANIILGPIKPLWHSNDQLFPIPQTEMDANPNLKPQNPGY